MRRYGDRPSDGRRYRVRPGAYAVLPHGRALLITHQSETDERFQLPGGGIDPGESPMRALYREVLEETGWTIAAPRRLGAFRRFVYMPEYALWAEKVCHMFTARPVRQVSAPIEEFHTALWMDARIAAEVLGNPGDRAYARLF